MKSSHAFDDVSFQRLSAETKDEFDYHDSLSLFVILFEETSSNVDEIVGEMKNCASVNVHTQNQYDCSV